MQLTVIRTLQEFEALSGEWNALLTGSASHVPFLRHEYLKTWWSTLGGGEWASGELFIVTGRADSGELVGIAPLFYTPNLEGVPSLLFLGSIEISDYLDLICSEENLPEFTGALFDFLSTQGTPDWKQLDLYNLIETAPSLPLLEQAAGAHGWNCMVEPLQHCPAISLPAEFEEYLASIDKKQRHEIRRKLRRAQENVPAVELYITQDESRLDQDIETFFQLMATDPDKEAFLTPQMREQMKLSARQAFNNGWLQLAFARIGEEMGAAYLNFDYQNQIWVYNSGFEPRFRELSLGWVLLAELIQWSIEHGRESFDFMRGDEDYKYRFGGKDRRVKRLVIRKNEG